MKTREEILTKIYKRSISHWNNVDKFKISKTKSFTLSFMLCEVLEAMEEYANQFKTNKNMEKQYRNYNFSTKEQEQLISLIYIQFLKLAKLNEEDDLSDIILESEDYKFGDIVLN